MGNLNDGKHIALIARFIERHILPDVCQLYPAAITGTMLPEGVLQPTPTTARQYKGSANIPCRADLSRAFRPEKLKAQPIVVDEYNLELPRDVVIDASDRVVVNGHTCVIRKLKVVSEWDTTREALIEELDAV